MAVFYAWGILEKYDRIYDMTLFRANKDKFIGKGMAMDQGAFTQMVKALLKEKGKYAIKMEAWYRIYSIRYAVAKNEKLVKLYHSIKGIE